jgi:prepilin-type processing-associated H-X9-DG protein
MASGATARCLAGDPNFIHEAWRQANISGASDLNSPNHIFKGQNVLYLDGHVDWTDNPWCGVNFDNIWVMRKKDGDHNLDGAKVETLRSWDDGTSYDGKRTLPADSVDDSFLVP